MKRCLALLLVLLTAFSALTVAAAAETEPLLVYDLLKVDVDADKKTCYTVEIFFQNHMCSYDSAKEITFRDAKDAIVAVCRPHADNVRLLDLYAPDGSFGVVLDPTRLYYLTVPEGAYCTDGGVRCAEYRGEYNGVYLSDCDSRYTIADLGISEFLATNTAGGKLYAGRIRISPLFDSFRPLNNAVTLFRKTGMNKNTGEAEYALVGVYPITDFKKGSADVTFGGAQIDRYASYRLQVEYGTFFGPKSTINGRSDYLLSGKKLLGLREDYPAIDLLIRWFGADHWTLKTITTALNVLAKIKLVDKALAADVSAYIAARKN